MSTKTYITLALVALFASSSFAQVMDTVPNAGFENWVQTGPNYSEPVGWFTSNPDTITFPSPGVTPDSLDVHSGRYAARLVSNWANGSHGYATGAAMETGPYPGGYPDGCPIHSRPLYLQGWYKYFPNGIDTANAGFGLFQGGSNIAFGILYLPPVNAWTQFTIPLSYGTGTTAPDQSRISFGSSSGIGDSGSVMLLDDLSYLYVPPGLTAPTFNTDPASNVQLSSAQLNGTINPQGSTDTISFEWGTTSAYGSINSPASPVISGTSGVSASASIFGLQANTTYYYRVDVTTFGTTYYGNQQQFFTSAVTGINETSIAEASIYPNPAKHNFTIETHSSDSYALSLYNMVGEKVLTQVILQPVVNIDISTLPGGIYTVSLKKDEAVKSYRLVIIN